MAAMTTPAIFKTVISTFQAIVRSPDGAQHNPGFGASLCGFPDFAPFHPGYALNRMS
jgi:hypothetical protein